MNPPVGRPRGELSDGERVVLIERAERVRVLDAEARQARHDLAVASRIAQENGASLRVIAEAIGLSDTAVHSLIRSARE